MFTQVRRSVYQKVGCCVVPVSTASWAASHHHLHHHRTPLFVAFLLQTSHNTHDIGANLHLANLVRNYGAFHHILCFPEVLRIRRKPSHRVSTWRRPTARRSLGTDFLPTRISKANQLVLSRQSP